MSQNKITWGLIIWILLIAAGTVFASGTEEVSNFDKFETRVEEKGTADLEKSYKWVPKFNNGFIVSSRAIRPHLGITIYEKDSYTLDTIIAHQTIGLVYILWRRARD